MRSRILCYLTHIEVGISLKARLSLFCEDHLSIRRSLFRSSSSCAHAQPQPPCPPSGWALTVDRRPLLLLPLLLLPLPSPASSPRCELPSGYKVKQELDLNSTKGDQNNIKVNPEGLDPAEVSSPPSSCRWWTGSRWRQVSAFFVTVFGAEGWADCCVSFSRSAVLTRSVLQLSVRTVFVVDVWIYRSFIDKTTRITSFTPRCPLTVHPRPHSDRPKRGILALKGNTLLRLKYKIQILLSPLSIIKFKIKLVNLNSEQFPKTSYYNSQNTGRTTCTNS